MPEILVLGGGFGGLAAATHLRDTLSSEAKITVIDRVDTFFPGLAKLWDMVGLSPLEDNSRPLANLSSKGIDFVQAEISSIEPGSHTVHTSAGTFSGDALLVALGAAFKTEYLGMLDAKTGFNLYDARSLPGIKQRLKEMSEGRVVVGIMGLPYKCPPAPYEAVMLLDEWLRAEGKRDAIQLAVHTPQPSPLPVAGAEASAAIAAELQRLNIELFSEHQLIGATRGELQFADGSTDRYDLFLGIPAHVVPPVLGESGLTGPSGWIEPDRATLVTQFDRVYAVGDCTHIPNAKGALPKAGVFAEKEALVAAGNIAASFGYGEPATLDGLGFCFLEFPGRRAANVEGDFFAEPEPAVRMTAPSQETFRAKEAFVSERLDLWL